jgi:hypothetical protein
VAWQARIERFKVAVDLRDAIRAGDKDQLGRFIKWKRDDQSGKLVGFTYSYAACSMPARSTSSGGYTISVSESRWSSLGMYFPTKPDASVEAGEMFRPGLMMLQTMIDEELQNVASCMLFNTAKTRLVLHRVPENLYAACWLQLARAVDGNRDYSKCGWCGNWFEISSPEGAKRSSKFCSGACKQRDYRKRREQQ